MEKHIILKSSVFAVIVLEKITITNYVYVKIVSSKDNKDKKNSLKIMQD